MQEVNMLGEAFKFMLLGMGIVFAFLVMMMYALKVQAYIVGKYFPDKKKDEPKTKGWQPSQVEENNSEIEVAAVIAAIQHHRNLKG